MSENANPRADEPVDEEKTEEARREPAKVVVHLTAAPLVASPPVLPALGQKKPGEH